jgi:hypothetical protein
MGKKKKNSTRKTVAKKVKTVVRKALKGESGMDRNAIRAAAEAAASKIDKDDALSSLRGAVEKVISRVRQNMVGTVRDNAQSVLARFSATLQARLLDLCQVWAGQQRVDVIPVLPDNCKYYTKVGNRTAVVIEHRPQVRSLIFSEGLMDGCPDRGALSEHNRMHGKPYAVSLPYIVFTVSFVDNKFQELRVNFRTKPLENLNDQLYFPSLPNFANGDSKVCFGQMYSSESTQARLWNKPLVEQVNEVITTFYNSVFNTDYPDYYKGICNTTPTMRTLAHWIASSKTDPAFILKVQFKPHCQLKEMMTRVCGGAQQVAQTGSLGNAFTHEMQRSLAEITDQLQVWLNQTAKDIQPDQGSVSKALTERLAAMVEESLKEALGGLEKELIAERKLLEQERLRMIELLQERKVGSGLDPFDDEYDSWRRNTW